MLALIGAILLTVAFILNVVAHHVDAKLVTDLALAGLALYGFHLAFGWPWPWRRPGP